MVERFIKVGRVYWIKPLSNPGMKSKQRPAIALEKYGSEKVIFIHLGSSCFKEKSSQKATHLLWKSLDDESFRPNREKTQTFIHIDASKPEWITSIIKPHYKNKYIDIDKKTLTRIRGIYHNRRKELEIIWFKKAKIALINDDDGEAIRYLTLIKNKEPIKHRGFIISKWINNYKKQII